MFLDGSKVVKMGETGTCMAFLPMNFMHFEVFGIVTSYLSKMVELKKTLSNVRSMRNFNTLSYCQSIMPKKFNSSCQIFRKNRNDRRKNFLSLML